MNTNMAYGHQKEEEIRQLYEGSVGEMFMPTVVTHPDIGWLVASLDGLSGDKRTILEIKVCNKGVFAKAKEGRVPEHYMIQVQHQMACCPGVEKAVFIFWNAGEWTTVKVEPCVISITEIIREASEFYQQCLINDQPPQISEKDHILIDDPAFNSAAHAWIVANRDLKLAKEAEKEARATLLELTDDGNCSGGGLEISRIWKPGAVDYGKIPELKGVNLDTYRKPTVGYTRIRQLKE